MSLATLSDPLTALRVICGAWFLPHCVGKLRNIDAAAMNSFRKAGLPRPRLFVYATIALELLAACGLVLGVYARIAAAMAVVVLMGASIAVVKINGFNWRWQKQGPEYMIFWAVACTLSVW